MTHQDNPHSWASADQAERDAYYAYMQQQQQELDANLHRMERAAFIGGAVGGTVGGYVGSRSAQPYIDPETGYRVEPIRPEPIWSWKKFWIGALVGTIAVVVFVIVVTSSTGYGL